MKHIPTFPNRYTYRFLVFLFTAFISYNTYSQLINIKGVVADKETNKPIPYASIQVQGSSKGTVSNIEGEFNIKVSEKHETSNLVFLSLGYQREIVAISHVICEKQLMILLTPKNYEIDEVIIKPIDPVDILRKAIEKIPDNYSNQPVYLDGFYREMLTENDKYVELGEAALKYYYAPYSGMPEYNWRQWIEKRFNAQDSYYQKDYAKQFYYFDYFNNYYDQVEITESRSSDYLHNERYRIVIQNGPLTIMSCDFVKNYNSDYAFFNPLNQKKMHKNYTFKLNGISTYNNRQVYVVSFTPIKNKNIVYYEGLMYIDSESLAFVGFDFHLNPEISKILEYKINIWNPALFNNKEKKCKNYYRNEAYNAKVNYKEINGKWYLDNIRRERRYQYVFSKYYVFYEENPQISYSEFCELMINNIELDSVNEFNQEDLHLTSHYSILQDHQSEYNEPFWNSYNRIPATVLQDSILRDLESLSSLESQYKNKFKRNDSLPAPVAKIVTDSTFIHNDTLLDNYAWMQNPQDNDLLNYIDAENEYANNYMYPLKKLKKKLYQEMADRLASQPAKKEKTKAGNYYYYYNHAASKNYPELCRQNIVTGDIEVLIDGNKRAEGEPNYYVFDIGFSSDSLFFVFNEFINDDYNITSYYYNIEKKQIVDSLENSSNATWFNNSSEVIYISSDSTNRLSKIWMHKIGSKQSTDELIFEEKDKSCDVDFEICANYTFIESYNMDNESQMYFFKNTSNPIDVKLIKHREDNVTLQAYEADGLLYFKQNDTLYYTSADRFQPKYWIVKQKKGSGIVLKDYLVEYERTGVNYKLLIKNKKEPNDIREIKFKEDIYLLRLSNDSTNWKYNRFRFTLSTFISPTETFSCDAGNGDITKLFEDTINLYNPKDYAQKLLWVPTTDGQKIPLTIVYKKGLKKTGKAPVLLSTYGMYGMDDEKPKFNLLRLPLLDRGVIWAYAHVRGGGILGNKWYLEGRGENKANTFNDFIACAEYLIAKKYTTKDKLVVYGSSAGGLAVCGAANKRPDLFNSVIAMVPYVDVLTSMLDSTGKFTTSSYIEIGNPYNIKDFNNIKSYSPYQNIQQQDYPNMLFTTGMNDQRVKYWHALKMVAKLRALKTDNNILLLNTDLYTGHLGYTGKYDKLKHIAYYYAFLLYNLSIKE